MDISFNITKAAPNDAQCLSRLFFPQDGEESFQRRMENVTNGTETVLFAEFDGRAAGIIIISFKNDNIPLLIIPNRRAYFYGLTVLPEFRRMGIGKALLTEAIGYCSRIGYREQTVLVYPDNLSAISLYEKLGFKCILTNQTITDGDTKILCNFFVRQYTV